MNVPAILRPHVVAIDRAVPRGVSGAGEILLQTETIIGELRCLLDPVRNGETLAIEGRVFQESITMFVDGRIGQYMVGQTLEIAGVPFVAAFRRHAYPDLRQGDRVRVADRARGFIITNVRTDYALYPVMEATLSMQTWIDAEDQNAWR